MIGFIVNSVRFAKYTGEPGMGRTLPIPTVDLRLAGGCNPLCPVGQTRHLS